MSNATLTPLTGSKKLVLALVAASICAMFAASFAYRTMHPSLTEPGRSQAAMSAPSVSSDDVDHDAEQLSQMMGMLQAEPNNPEVLKQITEHFIRKDDFDRANFFAQKALVVAPSDPHVLYMNGIILFNLKRPEDAAGMFEALISLEDDPSARYNLGVIYKHFLKQPDKAAPHFQAILDNPKADAALRERATKELTTEHK